MLTADILNKANYSITKNTHMADKFLMAAALSLCRRLAPDKLQKVYDFFLEEHPLTTKRALMSNNNE